MKSQHLTQALFLMLVILAFAACSNDEKGPYQLNLGVDQYELLPSESRYITILSGNKDYSVKVADEAIVEATADIPVFSDMHPSSMPFGGIRLSAKKRGETTLTVTDNVTRDSETVIVRVTDPYLGFKVIESNHTALSKERWMYLIVNDRKDAYFFEKESNAARTLLVRGTHQFTVENGIPYLMLNYSESNGQFTDAAIAPVPHKFNIKNNDQRTFAALQAIFNIDWKAMDGKSLNSDTRTSVVTPIYMKMKVEGTDQEITTLLSSTFIPTGVLKE